MLLFRSEEQVNEWCRGTSEARGETVALDQVWTLAQAWYGDRMAPDFRGRSHEEAIRIFERVGLTSAFWK